jgi:rSAM/selenodomain-associated transferase 2
MISVVIPTLNEALTLPYTLPHTRQAAGGAAIDLVVADCNSRDDTVGVAGRLGARVVGGAMCRADAQNRGAAVAAGEVLLFLHADSWLPAGFPAMIRRALADPRVVGGAFDFAFSPHPDAHGLAKHKLDWVVLINRIRYRWTGNFYGDQAIFVRRAVFDRVGGFPPVRLMEDIGLSSRIKRLGRTAILRPPILTSPRRFLSRGVVRQFAEDLMLLTCASFDGSPQKLWEKYNGWNRGAWGKTS